MRILFVFILLLSALSFSKEVPFTQEDRDRLIRLEEGLKATNQRIEEGLKATNQRIEEGLKATNQRIDDLNKRIDDVSRRIEELQTLMLWGFGILFGGMGILIGFVIWDRRTAIEPVQKKVKELESKGEKMERVLKDFASRNPELKEIMKREGLL